MKDPVVEEILKVLATVGEENHDLFAACNWAGRVGTYACNPRLEFVEVGDYPIFDQFVRTVKIGDRQVNDLLFRRDSPHKEWEQVKSALKVMGEGSNATVTPNGTISVDGRVVGWTYPNTKGKSTKYTNFRGRWVLQDSFDENMVSTEESEVIASSEDDDTPLPEYTGGSSSYYTVDITKPTAEGRPAYTAECNDIIEALGMNYAEGNAFKALWRRAAARTLGLSKKGYDDGLYDAEKVEFFGHRLVEQSKNAN